MSLAEQLKRMQQMMTMGYDGYFAQKNAEQARINQANREINDRMTAAFAATPEPERLSIAPEMPSAQQPLQLSEAQYQAIFGEQAAQTQTVSEQPQQKEILTYTDADYGIERSYLPFEQVATAAAKAYNWASDADYEAGKANVEAARNLGAVPDTLIRLVAGDEKAIESAKSGLANIDEHVEVGGHGIKRAWNDRQTEAVKNAVKDAMQEDLRALTLKGLYQSPEHKALRETIGDFDWQWDNFIRDAQRGAVDIGGADPEAYFNEQHGQNWWQRTVGYITRENFRALNQRMKTAFEHYVQHGNTAGRTLIPAINERGKVLVENRVKLRDYEDAAEAARDAEAVKAKMGVNPNKHDYRYDAAFKLGDGVASSAPALIAGAGTMGLTRNPALASKVAAGFMAAPVAGRAYHDARVAGASPNRATVYAAIYAAAEYLPEKVALNKFFSGMGQKWYKQVLRQAGVEFLQEGITETAQVLADKGVLHQDITLGEAIHRITEAAVLGGTIGGLMGGASAAMAGAAERLSTANPSTQPSNNANNRSSANPSNSTEQSSTSPASSTNHSQAVENNSTMQPLLSPEELAALRTINPTDATTVELMQERFANEPNMSSARRETLNKQLENIRNRHSEAIAKEIQSAMAADVEISGEVAHQVEDFIANAEAQSLSLVNAPKAPAPELSELPQEIQDFLNGESTDTAEEAQTAPIAETVAQSNAVQPSPAIQAHERAFSEAAFAELEAINPEEAETVALAQEAIDAIAANPRIEAQDKQERIEPLQQGIADIFARNHVAPLPAQASHSADNAQAIEPLPNTSPLPIVEAAMDEVADAAALAAATQAEMERGQEGIRAEDVDSDLRHFKRDDETLFEAARRFFREKLQGKYVETMIGKVHLLGSTWNKMKNGMNKDEIKPLLIPFIPDILQNGNYDGKAALKKEPTNSRYTAFHAFSKKDLEVDEQIIDARITVGERNDGEYDFVAYSLHYQNQKPPIGTTGYFPEGYQGQEGINALQGDNTQYVEHNQAPEIEANEHRPLSDAEMEAQYRPVLDAMLGKQVSQLIVLSNTMPNGAALEGEGLYDRKSGKLHLNANRVSEYALNGNVLLSAEQRLAWVAWHELFHRGLARAQGYVLRGDKPFKDLLKEARRNPFVAQLAKAIQAERKAQVDTNLAPQGALIHSEDIATEEALAEIAAAIQSDKMNALIERYKPYAKLSNPPSYKALENLVERMIEIMRRLLALVARGGKVIDSASDEEIIQALRTVLAFNFDSLVPQESELPHPNAPLDKSNPRLNLYDAPVNAYDAHDDAGKESPLKKAFTNNAKMFLEAVEKHLAQAGFAPIPSKQKSKKAKAVSLNWGGIAVSGDVSLRMQDADGLQIYATINADSLMGGGDYYTNLMYRLENMQDGQTFGSNHWYPLGEDNNTAQQVAEALLEMYRTYQQSNSNKGQANATLEESATEDENNGRAEQYQTTDEAGTVSPLSAGSTEAGRRRFGSDTTDSGGDLGGSDKLVSGVRERAGNERERSDDVGERLHEAGVSGGSRDAGVHDGNAARDGVEQDDTDNWQENYQEDSEGVYELGEFVPSFDELMAQEESRTFEEVSAETEVDFSVPSEMKNRQQAAPVGENHRINPEDLLAERDWFARAQANVEAIRLAKRLKAENALPNEEERKVLARFTGWGASAFNKLFDERKQPMIWKALNAQLREITTQEEYDYILRSTQYAHYTSPEIVQAIYQGLSRLGFKGGRVLEPASGVGIFNGLMPDEMAHSSHYTGVEIDAITGLIAQLLYPQSEMRIGDFTQWRLPRKAPKYDVVVGNPPFADIVVKNAVAHQDARLHDFFFLHSMDALREGGIMAFITSTGTMDKTGEKVRAKLAEQADLLAAFRLPNTAFAEAGTEAVTDILFLQKRGVGQESNGNAWRSIKGIKLDGQSFALNEYYHQHPSHILGELKVVSSAHGAKLTVASNGRELAELLTEAMQSLPQNVFAFEEGSMAQAAEVLEADFAPTSAENAPTRLGAVFVANGNLMRVNEYGEAMPLTHRYSNGREIALKDSEKNFLKDYVGLRDAVLQAQRDQLTAKPDETYWQQSLAALQKNYRAFVKKHGRLLAFTEHERIAQVKQEDGSVVEESVVSTRHKNRHLLSLDAQSFVVSAIEKVTPERSKNGEAVIVDGAFLGDTRSLNAPQPPVIENAFDAMMVAMSERGRTDVARAAALLGVSEAQIVAELGDRIYQNPLYTEDNQADKWIFADEYLTGDVVEKLKAAKAKARENAAFERNVLALEAVIPTPIPADEIAMRLGANWIPEGVYQQFVQEVLQSRVMKFHYHRATGQWSVNGGSIDAAFSSEYFKDNEFIEKVLNNKEISVKRRLPDDTYYIDVNATASANLKADLIKERFSTWALENSSRAQRLAEIYNERFNNIVPPQYDGSHLRLVGASNKVELRPHQKNAVYRITRSGDTYLNHTVGAGKTFTMIAAAMEERRLGLIKKPMFVVPNHMLMQFSNEFLQLYPSADLMIADEENFAAHNRKLFVAQAAMNNPDAIIITHSAFSRIGVSLKTQQEFIEDELAALAQTIDMVEQVEGRKSLSLKQWQKVKQRKEEQLKALLSAERKDNHISFEELGVDRLYIDEAHEFRKLSFATAMNRIRGIDPNGSQKAADLMMKLRDLRRANPDNQRTVVFASGTPVTNTMGELYTVLRYFRPQMLEKDDTAFFDSWARQFGEVVEDVEMDASGDYKAVKRFAKFVNIPELMRRVLDFMDVVSSQDLSAYVSRPEIKSGERQIVITEESEAFKGFQNTLRQRMVKIKNRGGKPEKGADIMLNVIGDGRLGALDLRFIDNTLPPDYDNKVNRLIADVAQAYKDSAGFEYFDDNGKVEPIKGASIVVFSDLGFGKGVAESRGFDLRQWTVDELVRLGVDRNHIAFIDDFNSNAKKRALFEDMKQGRKRILIGGKGMETGMNIQKRLKYLFHLDAPWFPSSMEQREGRIIRQGNQNKEVDIRAYATYGSYDSAMWATLARKARFIEQIFSGDFSQRSMEDVGQASQFEEAAAMVSNDPNAQKLNELKKRVDKLEREERGYLDEQRKQKARIKEVQGQIDWAKGRLVAIADALQKYKPLNADNFSGVVLGKKYHKRAEFGEALLKAFDKRRIGAAGVQKLAEVGGYEIQLRLTSDGRAFLDIAIPYKNVEPLIAADAFEKATPSGLPTKIENRISDLPVYQETMQAMLEKAERDLISLEAAQGKVFPRTDELKQARAELEVFEQEISGAAKAVQEMAANEAKEQEQERYSLNPLPDSEFARAVDEVFNSNKQTFSEQWIRLGTTPAVLVQAGIDELPIFMNKQKIGKIKNEHKEMTADLLKQIPNQLNNPVAIFKNTKTGSPENSYVILTELLAKNGNPVIAAIHANRVRDGLELNKLASVYGRNEAQKYLLNMTKYSDVRFVDKQKAHKLQDTLQLLAPETLNELFDKASVVKDESTVNPTSPLGTEIRGAAFQVDENGEVLYSIAPIDYVRTKVMRHEIFTGEGFKRLMLDRMRELERIKEALNNEQMDSVMNAFRSFNGRVNHELESDINPLLERWGKQVLPEKALELRRKIPKYQGMSKAGAAAQLMTDLDAIISFVLHGEERNMVIAAKLKAQGKQLDKQDYAGSGMTDAEIADLRALYESDDFGNGLLIDYAQEFYQTEVKPLLEQSKQKLRDAGLLTPEMEQQFPTYEYYVPLYGAPTSEEQIEQAIIRDYAPRLSDEALKNTTYAAQGRRGTKAHSIFETLITQAKIAANRAQMQQNKERLWHLLSDSEAAREEFQAKLSIHHAKDIEVDVVDEYGGAEHITIRKDAKHEGSNLRQIVWQQGNVFYVMEIGNERALDAIRNINRNAVKNPLIRAIGALTRWSASWITVKNITWQPVNKIRDSMDMFHYILADAPLGEMNDLRRSAVALKAAWLNTRYTATGGWDSGFKYWLEEYASLGGVTSYNELLGMNQLEELERMVKRKARGYSVNVARVYGNLTARLSLFLEMTTRVSAYRALVEAGVAQEEAAMYVKNVMNFETKGDLAANMGAFYMFFTSAIYGSARLLSSLKTRRGWISLTMLTAFSLAVKQVIRGLLPKDDEGKTCLDRYDAVSSTNFVIFPVLSEDGVMRCEGVRLPVGFGYGRLSNGIASGLDRLLHGGKVEDFISDTLNGVIIGGLSPISPTARSWSDDPTGALFDTFAPSAVKPLLQFNDNKNFRGGKIYDDSPYRGLGELDYNSGFDGTRDSDKALARWIYDTVGWDIHPETIAHFGRSYMNGLYEPLMDAAEMAIDHSGEGRLSVGSDLSHVPFVNRFRQRAPSDLATDYFRERDEAKDAFNRHADAAMRGKAFTHEKQQAAVKSQANAMLFKAADAALKKVRQERKSMREQAQLAKDAAKAGLNGDALTQRLQEINRQQQVAERRYHDTINVIYRRAVKQSEGLNDD